MINRDLKKSALSVKCVSLVVGRKALMSATLNSAFQTCLSVYHEAHDVHYQREIDSRNCGFYCPLIFHMEEEVYSFKL